MASTASPILSSNPPVRRGLLSKPYQSPGGRKDPTPRSSSSSTSNLGQQDFDRLLDLLIATDGLERGTVVDHVIRVEVLVFHQVALVIDIAHLRDPKGHPAVLLALPPHRCAGAGHLHSRRQCPSARGACRCTPPQLGWYSVAAFAGIVEVVCGASHESPRFSA